MGSGLCRYVCRQILERDMQELSLEEDKPTQMFSTNFSPPPPKMCARIAVVVDVFSSLRLAELGYVMISISHLPQADKFFRPSSSLLTSLWWLP